MHLNAKGNEYCEALGRDAIDQCPKAVFAAIAMSFALRLSEDDFDAAVSLLKAEWGILYKNQIVPQKPRGEWK